jgi:protein gp37
MADRSKIEWTDATWNPLRARDATGKIGWHCEKVGEACRFCYAEGFNKRLGTGLEYKPGHRDALEIFLDEKMLTAPLRWKKPRMIFVCSMTDLFADFVTDEMIDRVFAVMALAPQHTFQVLTKRPARMRAYGEQMTRQEWWKARLYGDARPSVYPGWPLPNVWLGVSAEDQERADERIPDLLATPATVRFVSLEPLLAPIALHVRWLLNLDWIIAGGESGAHARPMHPDWPRSIRDQCQAAGVPFFFKQWGEWTLFADDDGIPDQRFAKRNDWIILQSDGSRDVPDGRWPSKEYGECAIIHVGKKRAGRLLDGVEHNGMPQR